MTGDISTSAEAAENAVLRISCAAHADPDATSVEREPLPSAVTKKPVDQKSPAEWAYERIILYIQHFEKQLDQDHEVGMGFAGSNVGTLHIQGMGFFAPDMVTFYGVSESGAKMQLVQHVTQLNVMLRSEPKLKDEPSRIGFVLADQLET